MELALVGSGTSAFVLQQRLGFGSYRTSWRIARIIREALQVVRWPLLKGNVEVCDVNLARRGRTPNGIWVAVERRAGGTHGLMRAWRAGNNLRDDLRRIATALDPKATVITPPSGVYRELRNLGFHQRFEPVDKCDALPAVTLQAAAFRQMLVNRRHHSLAKATLEPYLAEFVFRHNAATLGWSLAEQRRRVLKALRAPGSSA